MFPSTVYHHHQQQKQTKKKQYSKNIGKPPVTLMKFYSIDFCRSMNLGQTFLYIQVSFSSVNPSCKFCRLCLYTMTLLHTQRHMHVYITCKVIIRSILDYFYYPICMKGIPLNWDCACWTAVCLFCVSTNANCLLRTLRAIRKFKRFHSVKWAKYMPEKMQNLHAAHAEINLDLLTNHLTLPGRKNTERPWLIIIKHAHLLSDFLIKNIQIEEKSPCSLTSMKFHLQFWSRSCVCDMPDSTF